MNNSTLRTADSMTHIKIVGVALVGALAVIGVGLSAAPHTPNMSTQLEARAPVLKAGQPVTWSGTTNSTIR